MDFSLFFFSAGGATDETEKYRLLIEAARFADDNGFAAVWTPERHFDPFGGLYPNPAITSAALATITNSIRLRAGSVVLPLHDPIRVAEEWSVVDNISGGRIEISFASGWHTNDFCLAPHAYDHRRQIMLQGIEDVQRLWRRESVSRTNGSGESISVSTFPHPVQASLPIWLTCQSEETFVKAGELGAGVLTNFTRKRLDDLALRVQSYKSALVRSGHSEIDARVALMVHSFVSDDLEFVLRTVRDAYGKYLETNLKLQGRQFQQLSDSEYQSAVIEHAVERLFKTSGLVGTQDQCVAKTTTFQDIGVTDLACLIDFGVPVDTVLKSLPQLESVMKKVRAG